MKGTFFIEVLDSKNNVIENHKVENTLMDNFIHSLFVDILGKGNYIQSKDNTLTHSWDLNPKGTIVDTSVDGSFTFAGGRNPLSNDNHRYVMNVPSYTTITVDMTSTFNDYFYILNLDGEVIDEIDTGVLTFSAGELPDPRYFIIAASYSAGVSGTYTVTVTNATINISLFADLSGNGHKLYADTEGFIETDGLVGDTISFQGYERLKFDYCNPFMEDFTLEGWIRITSNISGTIIQYARMPLASHKGRARLRLDSGYPQFETCDNTGTSFLVVTSDSLLSFNRWHHIAGVHSSILGNLLFVDGILKASNGAHTTLPKSINTETVGYIGATGSDTDTFEDLFVGDMCNVSIFSSAKYTNFFVPSIFPHFLTKCCKDNLYSNSNYKVTHIVLTKEEGFLSTDSNRVDDHLYYGVHEISSDDVLVSIDTPSFDVELSDDGHSVFITILTDELTNTGEFRSIKILGKCESSKTNAVHDDVTYPIISEVELNEPIGKRENTRIRVKWKLQIQPL